MLIGGGGSAVLPAADDFDIPGLFIVGRVEDVGRIGVVFRNEPIQSTADMGVLGDGVEVRFGESGFSGVDGEKLQSASKCS